jgi:hypothetical protein
VQHALERVDLQRIRSVTDVGDEVDGQARMLLKLADRDVQLGLFVVGVAGLEDSEARPIGGEDEFVLVACRDRRRHRDGARGRSLRRA